MEQALDSTSTISAFVSAYAAYLHDYCHDIQYDSDDKTDPATREKERLVYQKISVIWQLLQAMYFPGRKASYNYGTNLMAWLNRFDKRAIMQFDIQGVFNSPIPSRHASFWPLVYKLTLRGELDSLQRLVHIASERAPDPSEKAILQTVAQSIGYFPARASSSSSSSANREEWKDKATEGLRIMGTYEKDRSTLVSYAQTIIHIMLGDTTTLCHNAVSSVEAIVAAIYYQDDNTITVRTIHSLALQVNELRDHTHNNIHDQHIGLLSLLKGDIYGALEEFAQLDWWLLAHVIDILDEYMVQGVLDGDCLFGTRPLSIDLGGGQMEVDARSFFILTYARGLVEQEHMWETALDYMGTCGEVGKREINKIIGKISPSNDQIILGVVEYCTRSGLLNARQQIFEKTAHQLLEQHAYVAAIRYYYLAGNDQQIDHVFKTCLYHHYRHKSDLDPLDGLGRHKSRCDGPYARFYFRYSATVTLYKADNYDEAAQKAVDLLLMDSPKDVLFAFFVQSMTLLTQSALTLSAQTIQQLAQRFSEIVTIDNKEGLGLLLDCLPMDQDANQVVSSLCEMYKAALVLCANLALSAAMYSSRDAVVELTPKNFKQQVLATDKLVAVEFYAPWCGHCQKLAPEWKKAANNLKGLVTVAAINCDGEANRPLCGQYDVKGFPTIKVFRSNTNKKGVRTKKPTDYQGPREAKPLVDHLLSQQPSNVRLIKGDPAKVKSKASISIDDFLETEAMILFTDKPTTTPLYKALSVDFGGLWMGEVKKSEKQVLDLFGVQSFPTLLVLKPGEEASVYSGKLKYQPLFDYLSTLAPASSESKKETTPSQAPETPVQTKVEELASDKTLQHHCASGICVVAIVSPEEKDDLKVVHELHDQNTNGLFRFGWMTSDKASAIVKQLDLVQDYPGLFILHASKQLYRPYVGAWDQKSIARWLDQIASGRVQAFAFSGDLKISSEEQHQEKAARDEL
ncbi:hypothetical protein [Absidia glauca]|uniref:Nuclear pore complex protein Nup85 n=1 Tax=Absidia glauca TaxID=4829 RepID=A0A168PNK2_ABSGL|nr:hypothetical protein [Absidia glauca]